MSRIGDYEYPDVRASDILEMIQLFREKLSGVAKNVDALASALGHQTANSGPFRMKMAYLNKYGLIEGRGEIRLTPLAQKIIAPADNREKNEALKEMVFRIPLWKELYNRLNGNMPSSDFYIILQNITGIDRITAQNEAERISKLYVDAITKITIERDAMLPNQSTTMSQTPSMSNMIEVRAGDVYLKLPKTDESIDVIKNVLDGLKERLDKKK